jgi:putative ABC transport system ATP-binding protein
MKNTADSQVVVGLYDIGKKYDDEAGVYDALKNIHLEIKQGEFVAIMGPSGSGKSTLMNIVGLLDNPSKGVYMLDGVDTTCMRERQLAKFRRDKIGFVFQNFNLLPRMNILRNVELPLVYKRVSSRTRREHARKVLNQVGLGDKLKNRTNRLSGGQVQRAAIARALVNSPSLLLADEPTGNLDSKTSDDIMRLLQKLNQKGMTIVVVTHSSDIARYANRTIHMLDSKIRGQRS